MVDKHLNSFTGRNKASPSVFETIKDVKRCYMHQQHPSLKVWWACMFVLIASYGFTIFCIRWFKGVFGSTSASAFRCFSKVLLAWKNIKLIFLMLFDGFDVLMSKIKKQIWKKFILMHFQAKSYFEKHLAPQS